MPALASPTALVFDPARVIKCGLDDLLVSFLQKGLSKGTKQIHNLGEMIFDVVWPVPQHAPAEQPDGPEDFQNDSAKVPPVGRLFPERADENLRRA